MMPHHFGLAALLCPGLNASLLRCHPMRTTRRYRREFAYPRHAYNDASPALDMEGVTLPLIESV
jgi:hypothetical protein